MATKERVFKLWKSIVIKRWKIWSKKHGEKNIFWGD
jgi:hypothetical protein